MKNNRQIDICFTPNMINLFNLSNKQVVIIDVFRATSAMCVFLNNGGNRVIPVHSVQKAESFNNVNKEDFLLAAERNGQIVKGFDLGNSPLSYHGKDFTNKSLVITTTNGTMAIEQARDLCHGMLLASFLNISVVANYLISQITQDVLIICSGWKDRVCIEDCMLAGLLSTKLLSTNCFQSNSDSVLISEGLYNSNFALLNSSSYVKRMGVQKNTDLKKDIEYCLQKDIMNTIPIWNFDKYGSFSSIVYDK